MIKIVGAKGNIKDVDAFLKQVQVFAKKNNVVVQVFDADVIYGEKHLVSAAQHAIRAFERKTNTTNSLDKEILLYASGERQLKLAIPKMGVKKNGENVAFVFINNKKSFDTLINKLLKILSLERDDRVLEGSMEKLRKFGVTEKELGTVTKAKYGDLILEKVAMVDVIK
ncbi:MAG: KEOPS complex subunit Cgi121 [Candidatus Thermoplasmatota archaeon]|jgi:tRNA threonylcarbamoyladenosine modification (KEOPS) complex Cgi121 subunit|nr:KEOPS complex subunit Cgi121 [Candidatus Thermoplasmatota archaeon]